MQVYRIFFNGLFYPWLLVGLFFSGQFSMLNPISGVRPDFDLNSKGGYPCFEN